MVGYHLQAGCRQPLPCAACHLRILQTGDAVTSGEFLQIHWLEEFSKNHGISSLTMNQEPRTIPVVSPVFEECCCQQYQDKLQTKIEGDFAA